MSMSTEPEEQESEELQPEELEPEEPEEPEAESEERHYVSIRQLAARFSVCEMTIRRWVKSRAFPKPSRLSPGCTRWKISDIENWEAKHAAVSENLN